MRVLFAPDAFKGTVDAAAAAEALAAGWLEVRPHDDVIILPMADGGEGTLDAVARAVPGAVRVLVTGVPGPNGSPVDGSWLDLPDGTAVVELASVCGLPLLGSPDPLGAHTAGLGAVIADALRTGATALVVAVGGSASTDGGTGALSTLGARFLDDAGEVLPPGGGPLSRLASADLTTLAATPPGGIQVLTDVRNPLLGPRGAAHTFGPQKGATPEDIATLEAGLRRLASVLGGDPTRPGAGAAGGTAYGLAAACGATLTSGAVRIAELVGLYDAIAGADLVVTGEGRFDATSLNGKVVAAVLHAVTQASGPPLAIAAGSVAAPLPRGVIAAADLTRLAGSSAAAQADAPHWLRRSGAALATRLDRGSVPT
ncbi:glycerate kinase [Yinghuangia sp. ASG 101]|uniref:glycerate kinase n=1 Tax=Yinghuangia sp. ASG 101 TaxID=2896848 RepID=UPI001E64C4F9|nr:glycerate kinase [Yinghuangia sp. ASG 101]UGQ11412.1 glycerate kinase [Yinghuangia sp. ASG 101]